MPSVDDPGTALREALHGLRRMASVLRDLAPPPAPALTSLSRLIDTLGPTTAARPLRCPQRYVLEWQRYVLDPQPPLSPRLLRYLCWEPDIATGSRFQDYLEQYVPDLSARCLQGLVRSCHSRWSAALASSAGVQRIQARLEAYAGSDHILARWRAHAAMLLAPSGPQDVAATLLTHRFPLALYSEQWALAADSAYMRQAICQAWHDGLQRLTSEPALYGYLVGTLLPWPGWSLADLYAAVGAVILHPLSTETAERQAALIEAILTDTRLGDPRLPGQAQPWHSVPQEACQRFLHWLSRADITFFFTHVLPDDQDPQGRQAFWLQYAPRVLRSRVLFNPEDRARFQADLSHRQPHHDHLGHLHSSTSAFLLDFGTLVAVEFRQVSHACYLYEKADFDAMVADFWTPQPFTLTGLKTTAHVARIPHPSGWEKRLAEVLAQYGIMPAHL
jgi:hypothetical protein